MLSNLLSTWKQNGGNQLLIVALLTTTVVSLLWYFDAVPNIELAQPTTSNTPLPLPRKGSILVVTVVDQRIQTQKALPGQVAVFVPVGSLADDETPIFTRKFSLRENGVVTVVFENLNPGYYAPVAFVDLNENETWDAASQGAAAEPLRTTSSPDARPESWQLDENPILIEAEAQEFITFYF